MVTVKVVRRVACPTCISHIRRGVEPEAPCANPYCDCRCKGDAIPPWGDREPWRLGGDGRWHRWVWDGRMHRLVHGPKVCPCACPCGG